MKFMKLGSKPDSFQSNGSDIRFVASDLATDVVVQVGEVKFYLHKFPLLSKSSKLQKLVLKATSDGTDEISLHDFPGGPKAFDICAKFCYGMVVTLNPYNVVPTRCAAEYLEMTETVEKGNLIFKIEVFLNSSIFRSWKDTIIVLQSAKNLFPWSEELKIVGRCIDSIAAKTSVDPSNVNWSYTYSKRMNSADEIVEAVEQRIPPKDWWIEDLCELDVDLYKRVMVAIKSKGRMSADLIGEALRAYAVRWLPDRYEALVGEDYAKRNRVLVETIIWLLPSDKGPGGCSCRFLMKLLKVAILVGAGEGLKEELVNRVSIQLHKASVKDLLLPVRSSGEGVSTIYDVELVIELVRRYVARNEDVQGGDEKEMIELSFERENLIALGELVDGFLCEVASDPNLGIDSFVELATAVPEMGRPIHDGLYTAIDIYLKEHPDLMKSDKKRICGLMEVRKLSTEASIHAAQNDRLPLRVVVQVLFFEQQRTATSTPLPGKLNSILEESDHDPPQPIDPEPISLKLSKEERERSKARNSVTSLMSGRIANRADRLLLPSRSRRIFDKLWIGKGERENGKGESETSGSSQSPPVSVKAGEVKSLGSSRNRRYSVS
ncbi:hypothetical protein LUZ63_000155 [Rhynchospora breviuscula]|uniref:Uncharacterized protein n=1 Tax=Rhynchospora breviuscula TaxID=2022672 RepID=A0A9Q0HVX1_9POAL|nr:hypothetical protein LUZ63_000155 [Rhynchospora breviuscula]